MIAPPKTQLATLFALSSLPLANVVAAVCSNITIPVTAYAQPGVRDIDLPPLSLENPSLINDILNSVLGNIGRLWPLVPVGGTYDIVATYCEPELEQFTHPETIQLLGHGATYNRLYWQGHGLPDLQSRQFYSWVRYATEQGYATLAFDQLGSGESPHPSPLLHAQMNLSAEIVHQIVLMLRGGKIGHSNSTEGTKFRKIIYAGHSMGSLIGQIVTQRYHEDFNAVILTGWSGTVIENFYQVILALVLPAAVIWPQRWGRLDPAYLAIATKEGARNLFYGLDSTFDPAVQEYDFEHRDVVALGQLLTLFEGMGNASSYTGPVQVVNGELDRVFCSPNARCTRDPDAEPARSSKLFNSTKYSFHVVPGAGHNLNQHYSAPETFKVVHDFMRDNVT